MATDSMTLGAWLGLLAPGAASRWLGLRERERCDGEAEPPPAAEVRVHVCGDPFEAPFLLALLEEERIRCRLEGPRHDPYGLLFVPQRGYGRIVVPEAHAAEARALIASAILCGSRAYPGEAER
jgi:hypothetical protein